jgi:hypothetical protein
MTPPVAAVPSPQSIDATKLKLLFVRSLSVKVATTASVNAWPAVGWIVVAVPAGGAAGLVTFAVWKLV